MDKGMNTDTETEKATVELTLEQWSFIVSGLKDCATTAMNRAITGDPVYGFAEVETDKGVAEENRQLAEEIECQVFEALTYPLHALSRVSSDAIKEHLVEFCAGNDDGFTRPELVAINKFLKDIVLYAKIAGDI